MAYRSSSTKSTDGTSTVSVGVPAGVAANDIIIIIGSKDGTTNTTGAVPTGFTAFFTNTLCTVDGQNVTAGWKRASGADSGSYTFGTPGTASTDWICQAFAFSGRDTTNPPVASSANVQNTGQSSPVTDNANGVTAVAGDDLLWLSAPDSTVSGGVTGHTPPTSYTERQDATSAFSSASGATQDNVGAGATGTVAGSFTLSSGTSGYVTVLVRIPAAAASGTNPAVGMRSFMSSGHR